MLHEQFKDARTKYYTRPDKKNLSIIDAESRKIIKSMKKYMVLYLSSVSLFSSKNDISSPFI